MHVTDVFMIKLINVTSCALAFGLLLSCADSGHASGRGRGQRGERFQQQDANGDRRLSYEEFQNSPRVSRAADSQARFQKIDSNGDGYLTKNELAAARPSRRRQ